MLSLIHICAMMDLKAVGQRIKAAREAKNLTQEELAALVNLSTTHVSVIEMCIRDSPEVYPHFLSLLFYPSIS